MVKWNKKWINLINKSLIVSFTLRNSCLKNEQLIVIELSQTQTIEANIPYIGTVYIYTFESWALFN